jgi:hypothetical protein
MTVRPRIYVGGGGARRPQLTQLGRPDWDEIFGAIKQARPDFTNQLIVSSSSHA